jgi:hypothetical protein
MLPQDPVFAEQVSHSTRICLRLLIGDHVFSLGQVGPDYCEVCQPIDHPPCQGLLVMHLNDTVRHCPVELIDGMKQSHSRVTLQHPQC